MVFYLVVRKRKLIIMSAIFFFAFVMLTFASFHIPQAIKSYALEDSSSYMILIYIEEKKLYLFENNECIKEYPIASGKSGYPSPLGQWKITEKRDWGEGFGGCWLGLNVSWGKYGIHGTSNEGSIGHAASHGCIRMYNKDVKELYGIVPIGTIVIIRNGTFGPFGTGFRKLKPGDRGADVLAVQQRLKALGYYNGKESGIYGEDLKKALYNFQKEKKLKIKYTITDEDYLAMGFKEFE